MLKLILHFAGITPMSWISPSDHTARTKHSNHGTVCGRQAWSFGDTEKSTLMKRIVNGKLWIHQEAINCDQSQKALPESLLGCTFQVLGLF